MAGQQQVVIVEKRDPVAARRVEAGVGGLRPRQAEVALHQSQRVRSDATRKRRMIAPAGGDDDDFQLRVVLHGDRIEGRLQAHAARCCARSG
jgi:hypothetical protein